MTQPLNLCLHCGADAVTPEIVYEAPTPSPTDTRFPIPHGRVLDQVRLALQVDGFSIVAEAHGLTHDGNRYFGLLQVVNGQGHDDYSIVVGVRNSHDKTFPAALALGSGVFVCDNLAFRGEVKLARKHTRFIDRDLPLLVNRAVGLLGAHRQGLDLQIAAYKQQEIADAQAHDFIIRALDAGVVPSSTIERVVREWRTPSHDEFAPRTAWSLFNAFTEVLKGNARMALPRTQALHGLMDAVCGIAG